MYLEVAYKSKKEVERNKLQLSKTEKEENERKISFFFFFVGFNLQLYSFMKVTNTFSGKNIFLSFQFLYHSINLSLRLLTTYKNIFLHLFFYIHILDIK